MFTGIIQKTGVVDKIESIARGYFRMTVNYENEWTDLERGESIAFNGVCLSLTAFSTGRVTAELSPETLKRTLFGGYVGGTTINLERSLRLGDRMGGHMVQGHVDGIVALSDCEKNDLGGELTFRYPSELASFFVEKGSVAINGVSLTLFELSENTFKTALIPITINNTGFLNAKKHDEFHVETDIAGRYFNRFLDVWKQTENR